MNSSYIHIRDIYQQFHSNGKVWINRESTKSFVELLYKKYKYNIVVTSYIKDIYELYCRNREVSNGAYLSSEDWKFLIDLYEDVPPKLMPPKVRNLNARLIKAIDGINCCSDLDL